MRELVFYTSLSNKECHCRAGEGPANGQERESGLSMERENRELCMPAPRRRGHTRLAIYDFIVAFTEQYGFPPTIREIGQGLGLSSPGTVSMHLKHLEQDKLIERYANHARAIRVRGIL